MELARRRPDIPFAFVRLWPTPPEALARLRRAARAAGNVEIRQKVADPRALYGDARVLLAPSNCPESWGRVASEAQASGIPVLAADIGGLGEAVGDGGILVPPSARPEDWEQALSTVWDDGVIYGELSARARRRARRDEIAPRGVGDAMEALVAAAMRGASLNRRRQGAA
jgi:glycosyltransferase involved in cell wall biosynthesis